MARIAGIDLARLGSRKSSTEKVLLAAPMKRTTDVSNGWLSQLLDMGPPASASQFVRRFLMTHGDSDPRFRRILSTVAT